MTDVWEHVLVEAHAAHRHPDLAEFCAFPEDVARQTIEPYHIPAADLMAADTGLETVNRYAGFRDALIAGGPFAHWRETYRNTAIGNEFLDRFGCYEVIGRDAPYSSSEMRSFVIYAPAGLHYPWHHHPAEEIYLALAGAAEFLLAGAAPRVLRPGEIAFHPSGRPHAMTTHDHPVLACVLWRGDMEVAPILT